MTTYLTLVKKKEENTELEIGVSSNGRYKKYVEIG